MGNEQNYGIRVFKKQAFSIVSDSIFLDKSISLSARLVLSYLTGRPNGWIIYVSHLRQVLGISDTVWRRVRKELIESGYLQQFRMKDESGKIRWDISISDTPLVKSDNKIGNQIDTSDSDSDSDAGEV